MGLLALGLLVGLDNLAVATGVGMLGLSRRRRLVFAAACAVFEMAMPLVGFYLGAELGGRFGWVAPACLVACGVLVLAAAARREAVPRLLDRPAAMVLVPLVLSLDNLAAGGRLGAAGGWAVWQAAAVGALSGGLCLLGFALGGRVRLRAPRWAGVVAAVWLFGCAALFALADHS